MVLVSQPTHPAFYQDDERHHKCNVCASAFNIPPPTRHELMQSFTGAEIAALISEGCVIGSHYDFDTLLKQQLRTMQPLRRLVSGYKHWIGGAYLITSVTCDEGELEVPMRSAQVLNAIRGKLFATSDLSLEINGNTVKLIPKGDLQNVSPENLRQALEQLTAPCVLFMATGDAPDFGADHIVAVNMTRRILPPVERVEESGKEETPMDDEPNEKETTKKSGSATREASVSGEASSSNGSEGKEEDIAVESDEDQNSNPDSDTDSAENDAMENDLLETLMGDGFQGDLGGVGSEAGERVGKQWWKRCETIITEAKQSVAQTGKYPGALDVEVQHFRGGPCDSDAITTLVVPGGARRGWTVLSAKREKQKKRKSNDFSEAEEPVDAFGGGLCDAIALACTRAAAVESGGIDKSENISDTDAQTVSNIRGGQTVKLKKLVSKPELNGECAIVAQFEPESGRWLLRLRNGDGARVKPENLVPMEGEKGRVFAFWGDARWSRTQLLGEIARGHWGLCRGSVEDITSAAEERRAALDGRLAFAPTTEMTEEWMRRAAADMSAFRDMGVRAEGDDDGVGRD